MMVCDQYFPYIYYFSTPISFSLLAKLPIGMHFFFYPKNIKTLPAEIPNIRTFISNEYLVLRYDASVEIYKNPDT